MLVVLAVGDVHANLVQHRGPAQQPPGAEARQRPAPLFEDSCRRVGDAAAVGLIDVVALDQVGHGGVANVLRVHAAEQVVQQALAQGAVRDSHLLDAERLEDGRHDGHTAGKHRRALRIEREQIQAVRPSGRQQAVLQGGQAIAGDAASACEFDYGIVDRNQRSRRADRGVPATGAIDLLDHLKLLACRGLRPRETPGVDCTVREVPGGHRYAAHVEALHQPRLELAPENELRATAADVDYESRVELILQGVRYAQVDQPRFLSAADDLHAVPEHALCSIDEVAAVARLAQRIGADDAHVVSRQVADALTKALEACQRTSRDRRGELAAIRQPFRDAHHLLVAIDDLQTAIVVVGDDQVEAVGTEIQRGVRLIRVLLALGLRMGSHTL